MWDQYLGPAPLLTGVVGGGRPNLKADSEGPKKLEPVKNACFAFIDYLFAQICYSRPWSYC